MAAISNMLHCFFSCTSKSNTYRAFAYLTVAKFILISPPMTKTGVFANVQSSCDSFHLEKTCGPTKILPSLDSFHKESWCPIRLWQTLQEYKCPRSDTHIKMKSVEQRCQSTKYLSLQGPWRGKVSVWGEGTVSGQRARTLFNKSGVCKSAAGILYSQVGSHM